MRRGTFRRALRGTSCGTSWHELWRDHRQAALHPGAPAALQGHDDGVAQSLEAVRRKRAAVVAVAVEHDGRLLVRERLLDLAFDRAAAQMVRAGQVAPGPLGLLADVNQDVALAGLESL